MYGWEIRSCACHKLTLAHACSYRTSVESLVLGKIVMERVGEIKQHKRAADQVSTVVIKALVMRLQTDMFAHCSCSAGLL